ncbi:hypothetical protein F4679DRAFT_581796 [Xylaria curta]|nr:hypothetical protein F4679DRAFT_581796 [Xylaria curta]
MPSNIHGNTVSYLTKLIRKELDRVAKKDPSLQEHEDNLMSSGRARILTGRGSLYPYMSPDHQFWYERGLYYDVSFIVEVAYAAKRADLKSKLKKYINWVPSVCAVLTIDIKYLSPHQRREGRKHSATATLWVVVEEEGYSRFTTIMEEKLVICQNGVARPGELQISFKYFMPLEIRTHGPAEEIALIFRCEDLAHIIERADHRQRPLEIRKRDRL